MKTKSKISAYILRGAAVVLLISCVIVALSSAINLPNHSVKVLASENSTTLGANAQETAASAGAIGGVSPLDGTFTYTGSLGTARNYHTATVLPSGKVLVAGGDDSIGTSLNSTELYDPAAGTWTATGNLGTARTDHTATLLPAGKVLVAGGFGDSGFLSSAE